MTSNKEQRLKSPDMIVRTNQEYADWCAAYYIPESLNERGHRNLDGLWAWQEQDRRKTAEQIALHTRIADLELNIEKLRAQAATAEKWRGIALANDGDGRTVQQIQDEAIAEERQACLAIADSYSMFLGAEEISKQIRARGGAKT